jgi:hypothetical protein
MKKYQISEKRYLILKKDEIKLLEDGSTKAATFIFPRWVQFTEYFDEIDSTLSKLFKGENDIKLQLHIGGAWYVSVTTGFRCIDVRKFYMTWAGEIKATKTGFANRLSEWDRIKEVAREMKEKSPIKETQLCWTNADHFNQEGMIACSECNPFGSFFGNFIPTTL